jgi:type IV pilus assembly protein PilO
MALSDQLNVGEWMVKLERLPAPARVGLLGALFAAVVALYGIAFYGGQREELAGLRGELTKLEAKINESRSVASNLVAFKEKREALQQELRDALLRLPNEKELPVLLTDITSIGKKSGLEFRSFKPGNELSKGFYAEVPIQIEITGAYHEVGVFFDRVSQLSRIVNVNDLEMTIASYSGDVPRLKVRGVATTYRFKEGGAAKGAEGE